MPVPAILWICGAVLAASALLTQQILKPRLPLYRLNINLRDALPGVHYWWESSSEYVTAVPTQVNLFNDNYLPVDVHALWFDLLYMDWEGNLHRIGELRDRQQIEDSQQERQARKKRRGTAARTTTTPDASSDEDNAWESTNATRARQSRQPLWKIPGRSAFQVNDVMYIGLWGLCCKVLTNSRFYWSLWKGGGRVALPSTGVAHIRANGQTPLTVQLICDNVWETWSLQVHGVECQLRQLTHGWSNLTDTVNDLRAYTLQHLQAQATGHVMASPPAVVTASSSSSWLDQAMAGWS